MAPSVYRVVCSPMAPSVKIHSCGCSGYEGVPVTCTLIAAAIAAGLLAGFTVLDMLVLDAATAKFK